MNVQLLMFGEEPLSLAMAPPEPLVDELLVKVQLLMFGEELEL